MREKLGGGREIKRLASHLWEGESVDQMTTGTYGKGIGLVVLTDRRLLFVHEGMMSQTTEDFPMDKISSVQWSSGMLTGSIVIFASGNKSEISNVNKEDGKEMVDNVRNRLSSPRQSAQPAPQSAPPGDPQRAPPGDPMEQLKKLGELRDAGVVKSEEFEAKKAELLRRM
jgi:Bacterial PH domain/Short C-terminal domain